MIKQRYKKKIANCMPPNKEKLTIIKSIAFEREKYRTDKIPAFV